MSFEWFEPLRYQNAKMHGIMHGIHTQYNTKILDGVQKHSMSFECFWASYVQVLQVLPIPSVSELLRYQNGKTHKKYIFFIVK